MQDYNQRCRYQDQLDWDSVVRHTHTHFACSKWVWLTILCKARLLQCEIDLRTLFNNKRPEIDFTANTTFGRYFSHLLSLKPHICFKSVELSLRWDVSKLKFAKLPETRLFLNWPLLRNENLNKIHLRGNSRDSECLRFYSLAKMNFIVPSDRLF